MASDETENSLESNLTITFPSNTSHKSLSTELLVQNKGTRWFMVQTL